MSDKLVNRLRGQYSVGPNNEFGTRSFADFIPPISLEAADRIEELERLLLEQTQKVIDLTADGDWSAWDENPKDDLWWKVIDEITPAVLKRGGVSGSEAKKLADVLIELIQNDF